MQSSEVCMNHKIDEVTLPLEIRLLYYEGIVSISMMKAKGQRPRGKELHIGFEKGSSSWMLDC